MVQRGIYNSLLHDKMSGFIWCTKSAIERQCVQIVAKLTL